MSTNADKKILFTDLDGTLLTGDLTISPGTMAAINKMTELSHKLIIATGRPIQSAIKVAEQFGFIRPGFYIASYNGGLIYDCDSKKTVSKFPMETADVRHIFQAAAEAGLHCHTYTKTHVVAERESPELKHYLSYIKMPLLLSDDAAAALEEGPMKLIVMDLLHHDKLVRFRDSLKDFEKGRLNSVFSHENMLEYFSIKASKGNALLYLCDYFGIPVENSIAAGDEENDISMIKAAGVGAVMKNGSDSVKQYADYITEHDNNHDGIREIIERFVL